MVQLDQSEFSLESWRVVHRIGPVTDSVNCFSYFKLETGPDKSLGNFHVAMVTPTFQWKEPLSPGTASDWLGEPGLNE